MRRKFLISSFSFPKEQENTVAEAEKIAQREGISFSTLIMNLITNHVKVHAAGNPSFELNQWIEKPEFVGDPAIREKNEKWDKYLAECDEKEIAQLEGTFKQRDADIRKFVRR